MDKFLAARKGIIGSLKKLAAKGTSSIKKRAEDERGEASNASKSLPPSEKRCALKRVRRELDQLIASREILMKQLTSLAIRKRPLEEEFHKVREQISITKMEFLKAVY